MRKTRDPRALSRTPRPVSCIAALLALVALFEAPTLPLSEPVRATGDVLVLLTVVVASGSLPARMHGLRWLLAVLAGVLVVFRVERSVLRLSLGDEPLLYDQVFLLRHLFVLASDLWSWEVVGIVAAALAAVALVWLAARWLLRIALRDLSGLGARGIAFVSATLWAAPLAMSLASSDASTPAIRWLAPAIVADVTVSWRIHASVQRGLERSPYQAYASVQLARKPDVYWFFVESYGRFALEDPSLRTKVTERLHSLEREARKTRWEAVSAFSRAPVSGGRSWLAEASVLMGTEVRYEAVFHHLVGQIERVPNLVSFLAANGYHTVLLAPADRVRPGVEDVNYYRYARQVRFDDLGYAGPVYGWGIVPDQFSLERTHEQVLERAARPLFFNFHMVSSHAPWKDLPPLVDNWRRLPSAPDDEASAAALRAARTDKVVGSRLRRYLTKGRRFEYLGAVQDDYRKRYGRSILYELGLIERYLARIPGDAVLVVMGDHQPPFVTPEGSFDVPVHVFARDERWLEEFRLQGFVLGLLPASGSSEVRHEGLLSLVVRALVRGGGAPDDSLPPYRAAGATLVE